MPFIRTGRTKIYYEVHGDGPPLLFIHGAGGNHASWFNQVAYFSKNYSVYTIDLRGFGNSVDVEGYGRSEFLTDIALLMGELIDDPIVIIAQSLGGGVAVNYAAEFPDKVAGLVLADTLIGIDLPEDVEENVRAAQNAVKGASQLHRVLGRTALESNMVVQMLYKAIASFNGSNIYNLKGVQPKLAPGVLESLGAPILFIVGEEDVLFPDSAVKALSERISNSSVEIITKAGHSVYLESPQDFNAVLENWLNSHKVSRGSNGSWD